MSKKREFHHREHRAHRREELCTLIQLNKSGFTLIKYRAHKEENFYCLKEEIFNHRTQRRALH